MLTEIVLYLKAVKKFSINDRKATANIMMVQAGQASSAANMQTSAAKFTELSATSYQQNP